MSLKSPVNVERSFSYVMMLLELATLGVIWAQAGYEKVASHEFVEGMPKTLGYFASKNPYPFMSQFLTGFAMKQARLFGELTQWGEVLIALALLLSVAYLLFVKNASKLAVVAILLALLGGIFLNVLFWFAAGWTGPSTASVNLLMFLMSVVGVIFSLRVLKS